MIIRRAMLAMRTAVTVALVTTACGDSKASEAALVRDSAGVTIVDIPAARGRAVPVDTLDDPLWVLGSADGDLDADVTGVTSALFVGETVVLADEGSGTLRQYSLAGVPLGTGAGQGEGPGEMPMMGQLIPDMSGTHVLVKEFFRGLLHRYDDTLGFVSQQRLGDLPGGMRYDIVAAEGDGSLLAFGGPPSRDDPGEDGVIVRPLMVVERIKPDSARVDTLLGLPGGEIYSIGTGIRGRRFAMSPALVIQENGFVVSDGTRWELRWLDAHGALQRIVRLDRSRRVVTEAMRTAQLAADHAEIDELPAGFVGIRRMAALDFENPRFPDSLPPFDRSLSDGATQVWFREGTSPVDSVQHWLIFDTQGLKRVVAIPTPSTVLAVGRELILLRRENPDGIGFIELRSTGITPQ